MDDKLNQKKEGDRDTTSQDMTSGERHLKELLESPYLEDRIGQVSISFSHKPPKDWKPSKDTKE